MSIHWGNWDVRVYAADSWMSLAERFAAEHPIIICQIEAILSDPVPAVRLQASQNLHVLSASAPDRMWELGERIAAYEADTQIIASFLRSMWQFSYSNPERCETVLSIAKRRLDHELGSTHNGQNYLFKSFGQWIAQLYVRQGRIIARSWMEEWASNLVVYSDLLIQFCSSLRQDYFLRYSLSTDTVACIKCERAQDALKYILDKAVSDSRRAREILASEVSTKYHDSAIQLYSAAEKFINNAINQLYFGSGAHKSSSKKVPGLHSTDSMSRFFYDYAEIFDLIEKTYEPSTIHHLIELYEFLIPGNPVGVFNAFRKILLGRAKDGSYHYESLGSSVIIRIVYIYITDYRAIFDNDDCRTGLVAILQLFAEAGWPDALKLLYNLPDMLR